MLVERSVRMLRRRDTAEFTKSRSTPGSEVYKEQADDTGGMGNHALDGEVGLAGVGWPQHSGDAPARQDQRLFCNFTGNGPSLIHISEPT